MKIEQNPLSSGQKIGIGALVVLGVAGGAWYFLMGNKDKPAGLRITGYRNKTAAGPMVAPGTRLVVKPLDVLEVYIQYSYSGKEQVGGQLHAAVWSPGGSGSPFHDVDYEYITVALEQTVLRKTYNKKIEIPLRNVENGQNYGVRVYLTLPGKDYSAPSFAEVIRCDLQGGAAGFGVENLKVTPITTTPLSMANGGNYQFKLDYDYRGPDIHLQVNSMVGNQGQSFYEIRSVKTPTNAPGKAISTGHYTETITIPITGADMAKLANANPPLDPANIQKLDLLVKVPSEKIWLYEPTWWAWIANTFPPATIANLFGHWWGTDNYVEISVAQVLETDFIPTDYAGREVTVQFPVSPAGFGEIQGDTPAPYYVGDTIHVIAVPYAGKEFKNWEFDGTTQTKPADTTFTLTKTFHTIRAHFKTSVVPPTYTVNVSASPAGAGNVFKDPDKSTYASGETVTFSCGPAAGYQFSHWTVNGTSYGAHNPLMNIPVTGNMTVVAVFVPSTPTTGSMSGYIVDGTTGYPVVANVAVEDAQTQSNSYGYYSITGLTPGTHWVTYSSPGYSPQTRTVVITADEDTPIDVVLGPEATTIELVVAVSGPGLVDVDPAPPYSVGSVVTLTAVVLNFAFTGWYDVNGNLFSLNEVITVTLAGDTYVRAMFV